MMRLALICCLCALTAPALAAPLQQQAEDPQATAVAEAAFAADLAEAQKVGSLTQVQGWSVDLDGDGAAEVVGHIYSLFLCGNFNCTFVLQSDGQGGMRQLLFSQGMDAVEVLDSRTGGWRDLAVWRPDLMGGPATLVWSGSQYDLR